MATVSPGKDTTMDAKFPAHLVLLAALVTVVTLSMVMVVLFGNYRDALAVESRNAELQALSADILLFDEQLTSSALFAAYSGNTEWIERYKQIEIELIETINGTIKLADSDDVLKSIRLTEAANLALVDMEYQSFDLVERQQAPAALALLTGGNYRQQKIRYSNGMRDVLDLLETRRVETQGKLHSRVSFLMWLVPVSLIFSSLLWIAVYRALSGWRQQFVREQCLRNIAEAQVRAVNNDLENRVTERTEQLEQSQKRLTYQANYDELTGLPNRRYIIGHLQRSLEQLVNGQIVTVLLIDLDHFKTVNDTLGHAAGDELLIEVGARITDALGQEYVVARLGGDEFLIVNAQPLCIGKNTKYELTEKILDQFKGAFVLGGHEYNLPISPSIGVALAPEDGADVEEIMRNADLAMYAAKENGRNGACMYLPEMKRRSPGRVVFESKLRSAVSANDQFQLHYQPQVDLSSNRVVGVEALLRWNQPEDGMIGPDRFIPLAEDTGLILDIGRWVLFEAARQLREWRDNEAIDLNISINVASQQLKDVNFYQDVVRAFIEHGIDTDVFGIEVTERSLIGSDKNTHNAICSLSDLGVKLSLDDFGTGYSALGYLQKYPFDFLKIDRSFIRSILDVGSDAVLVESIINMSRNIDLRVVAEGTENFSQCNLLRQYGCDIAQGFYYSKPLPAQELVKFVKSWEVEPGESLKKAS